jgi:hypothetical protein
MLRIETECGGQCTVVRLIGRIRLEHLPELTVQLARQSSAAMDLAEVMLVDVDVVRFLGAAENRGIQLRHCPPFIREWITREKDQEKS